MDMARPLPCWILDCHSAGSRGGVSYGQPISPLNRNPGLPSCVRTVARNESACLHELLVVTMVALTSRAFAPESAHDFRVYLQCAARRGPSALFPRHATPGLNCRPISCAAHTVLSSLCCCGCPRPSLKLNQMQAGARLNDWQQGFEVGFSSLTTENQT
jgi:hypothetical protein